MRGSCLWWSHAKLSSLPFFIFCVFLPFAAPLPKSLVWGGYLTLCGGGSAAARNMDPALVGKGT